jgi:glycosyltransferase involved in cell wall biosynthesis
MNSAAVLVQALQSLVDQTWRDFEVIISDGESADDTVMIAKRFAEQLPAIRIDSRPDTGVYDAINRGVESARGDWFLVLGSDDRIHCADTLGLVATHLAENVSTSIVYGDVRMMAANQCGVQPGERYAGPMSLSRLLVNNVCQQAVLYRRSLFDTLGGFDLRYRLYADWDFNLRAAFRSPMQWIDVVIADYAATGMSASNTDAAFLAALPEIIRTELARFSDQRNTWPVQSHLLRYANRLRRHGEWSTAFAYVGSYLHLLARRVPVLLRQRRVLS